MEQNTPVDGQEPLGKAHERMALPNHAPENSIDGQKSPDDALGSSRDALVVPRNAMDRELTHRAWPQKRLGRPLNALYREDDAQVPAHDNLHCPADALGSPCDALGNSHIALIRQQDALNSPGNSQEHAQNSKNVVDERLEKRLMAALRGNDDIIAAKALRKLIRVHKEPLNLWFIRNFEEKMSIEEMRDMKQDFYWELWSTRGEDIKSSVIGYLFRQINNGCVRYIRDQNNADKGNQHFYEFVLKFNMYIGGSPYPCIQLDEKWAEMEDERFRAHEVGLVINAMGNGNRTALLHQLAGLSICESAQRMGISDNTVRTFRARAKQELWTALKIDDKPEKRATTSTIRKRAIELIKRKRGRPKKY